MNFESHEFYNCLIVLDDGRHFNVAADWIHNNDLDHWNNWYCDAGHSRIFVDSDNTIYSGYCFNDYLGKIGENWNLLDRPTICQQARCSNCTDDLLVKKSRL